MSLVSLVVPRRPGAAGGRRQCGGATPPRGRKSEAGVVGCKARRRGAEPGCGRFGVVRPVREPEPVWEAERVARRRTAPGEPVDALGGVGFPAQPGRARHGTRRGRAVLQRSRTVVRGHLDCGTGGDASTRRAVRRRAQGRSARHDDALRRTPEQTGSSEAGRHRGWRRPGPPVVHELRRARRGAHHLEGCQFNWIAARYSPGSLSA